MEYELCFDAEDNLICIFSADIGAIPIDEGNADYQQYLVDTDGGLPLPKETK